MPPAFPSARPVPILALDVADSRQALATVARLPDAEWVKVGLQLFTAAGPEVVHTLRNRGLRVFLDLKLHDIPNTVAGAVASAVALGADLLTLHASGGAAMLEAAREAADRSDRGMKLIAVTVLTSLSAPELAGTWGRSAVVTEQEVERLAILAERTGMDGVVASVHEAERIRAAAARMEIVTPGIRLPGGDAGDQARVATPADAARAGADYLVIGRAVTAARDPRAAWQVVLDGIRPAAPEHA